MWRKKLKKVFSKFSLLFSTGGFLPKDPSYYDHVYHSNGLNLAIGTGVTVVPEKSNHKSGNINFQLMSIQSTFSDYYSHLIFFNIVISFLQIWQVLVCMRVTNMLTAKFCQAEIFVLLAFVIMAKWSAPKKNALLWR